MVHVENNPIVAAYGIIQEITNNHSDHCNNYGALDNNNNNSSTTETRCNDEENMIPTIEWDVYLDPQLVQKMEAVLLKMRSKGREDVVTDEEKQNNDNNNDGCDDHNYDDDELPGMLHAKQQEQDRIPGAAAAASHHCSFRILLCHWIISIPWHFMSERTVRPTITFTTCKETTKLSHISFIARFHVCHFL